MAKLKTKYWIEAGDIKTNLPKQHDTGMFRSLDDIIRDVLKCCGIDCCEGTYPGSGGGATNLTYTASATNGTVVSDTGTDAVIPAVTFTNAGLATPAILANSHEPVTTVNSSITITQSGIDNQTLKADISGINTATIGQVPSTDGAGNVVWITPTTNVQNGLTEIITGEIEFGGTLIHDTTVSQDGYKLLFERNLLELTNTTKSIIGLTGVDFVGEYTEDTTTYGAGITAYFFNGVLRDTTLGITTPIFGREITDGTNYVRITQAIGDHEMITTATDGTVTSSVSVSDSSGVSMGYNDATENYIANVSATGYSITSGITSCFAADKTKIQSYNYINTRNDSGVTTPINFLYTDSNGVFLSSPISSLPSQNIYNSDGTLTSNRTVDQNGNSLIINTTYAGSGLETHIEQSNNIAGIGGEGVGFWTENTDGYLSALYASGGIAVNSSQNAANTQFSRTLNMAGIGYQFAGMSVSDGTTQNDFNVNTTDITVSQYPNTRDDSGITTPTNVLYTDASGKFLSAPVSSIVNANNGLTETLGNIQLGGTLLHDTTVTQGSNKLVFERFALELANTTKSILGLTDVNFVGEYTEDTTNFGSGVTAYFFNGILSDGLGNTAVVVGKETVGGTYTRTTQILAGNEVMTISTDGNVTTTVEISTNTGFLTNVSDISGSATSIEHSTNRWMASIVGTGYQHSVQLLPQGLLYSNGNLPSSYLFPTADGANGEVMMTNGLGVVSFEPTTNIVANEWHTTGNAGTDGGATNFVGTTDAQDLVLKTNNVEIARFKQQGNTTIGSDLTSIDALYISPLSSNPGDMAFQSGQATGIMSTAFGTSSATAPGSMAWGVGYKNGISPLASGIASTAWGDETSAAGRFSTCFGFQNTANAEYSTCFGQENTNNANYATVFGFQNTAEGTLSTVFGSANTVDIGGNTATIWGTGNLVSNTYGTAWGQDNFASGRLSTVFGKSSRAEALHSLASGFNNVASGDNSVVFGAYNNSVSYAEMVLGHYSTFYIPISITTINTADRLLTVGNGTDNLTKNNALTMWKDGRSMWNGDVAKQNTWIGVNGTLAQNFINVTTPTGSLAAISTEHTTSGNYAVLGSNAGNSGLAINNTKKFSFTTTAGTTSTALGATTTVANYSNTGFLFGGGGVADSTVDINGTLGLSNTRISTANPILTTNNSVYHFTAGTTGTVDMTAMVVDNRTFVLTNYSGVSLTLSNAVRTGSATTTTTLTDNTSMTIAYDGVEFFKIA